MWRWLLGIFVLAVVVAGIKTVFKTPFNPDNLEL